MAETINPLLSTHPHELPIHSIGRVRGDNLSGFKAPAWTKPAEPTRARLYIDPLTASHSEEEDADAEFESEAESITSYEDGIDQFDGPVWKDPLDREAVAAEMKAVHHHHRHTHSCGTQTMKELTGFEDDLDSLDGVVWDNPLDKDAVANQMKGCHHRNHHIEPDQKREARKSIEIELQRNPTGWLDGEYESPVEDDEEVEVKAEEEEEDNEIKSQIGGEKLHRCSVDTLDRISTEDLVAAATALFMMSPDERPLALCSHCGGSRLKRLASLKTHENCKSRRQKQLELNQQAIGDWVDENGILWQDSPVKLETYSDWVDENGVLW